MTFMTEVHACNLCLFRNPTLILNTSLVIALVCTFYTDYSKKKKSKFSLRKFLTEKVEEQKAAREGFHLCTPL